MVPEFALSFLCRAARCVACIAITRILGTEEGEISDDSRRAIDGSLTV